MKSFLLTVKLPLLWIKFRDFDTFLVGERILKRGCQNIEAGSARPPQTASSRSVLDDVHLIHIVALI